MRLFVDAERLFSLSSTGDARSNGELSKIHCSPHPDVPNTVWPAYRLKC